MAIISVIIPVFNEEKNIPCIVSKIYDIMEASAYDFEIIIINDGSIDNSLQIIENLSKDKNKLYFIDFSKNFGQQNALRAGYDHANGDAVICIDADLQNPPEMITEMINNWENGYEIVLCKRKKGLQHSGFLKNCSSRLFYTTLRFMADGDVDADTPDFRLVDKRVVDIIKKLPEKDIFLRGLISWMGFRKIVVEYDHKQRMHGETGYSPFKMVRLALSGITGFSVKPLHFAIYLGLFISVLSLFYIPYVLIRYFTGHTISGWSSLIITITFMGGLQLFILGILGLYLGKLFMQTKNRPNYIVRKTNIL